MPDVTSASFLGLGFVMFFPVLELSMLSFLQEAIPGLALENFSFSVP